MLPESEILYIYKYLGHNKKGDYIAKYHDFAKIINIKIYTTDHTRKIAEKAIIENYN